MNLSLSKSNIKSFTGDIVTLKLCSDTDLSNESILWQSSNDEVLKIISCSGDGEECFNDGVLLLLLNPGKSKVTVTFNNEDLFCDVEVTAIKHSSWDEKMNYYIGDMHAHTSFSDGVGTPEDALKRVRDEGALDFYTISDHGCFFTPKRIFETVLAAEKNTTTNFVPFAAQEADLYFEKTDDYGFLINQGGELLTYQAKSWVATTSWDDYFNTVGENPALMIGIPHPSDVGGRSQQIWNGYNLPYVTDPRAKQYLRFIEVINSPTFEAYNLLHERIFSQALDYGYKVCPTAGSDTHSWNWGEGAMWSRTVIMAPELTRESLIDAMQSGRVYLTESGNVKLKFKINGVGPGGIVKKANFYFADFSFDVLKPANENERIVKAELFSDYGEVVDSIDLNRIRGNYTLGCHNANARYFYLRLTDAFGDRTWSSPIWTENLPDNPLPLEHGKKIPYQECTILSASAGDSKEKIMNGNPNDTWLSENTTANIVIDVGCIRDICAMGYYHHYIEIKNCTHVAQLLAKYEIETSIDGNTYEHACYGNMRSYGGEQIIHFKQRKARFIRFHALSSVGVERGTPKYKNTPVAIGELSVYEK